MLHQGQAVLRVNRRAWKDAEVRAAALRAQEDEAELRRLIEGAKQRQRLDRQGDLHLVVDESGAMHVASRWDHAKWLDPKRAERRVAVFEVEGH